MIRDAVGVVGAAAVVLLPGCWATFGLPLVGLGFWVRVVCGVILSPAVVALQFYLLRWTGLSFAATCAVLPLVNLPTIWLIARAERPPRLPSPRAVLAWTAALFLPFLFLTIWTRSAAVRASWGHAWYHNDIVYMLAGGALRPEEPQLAGVRLGYPWAVDLFHGVTAWLLDSAPNSGYVWANQVWLVATIGLVAAIVKTLGGDAWARVSSVVLLCFGVNAVGSIGYRVVPADLIGRYPILGDGRYMPWLRKFGVFAGSAMGIALTSALAMLAVSPQETFGRRSTLALSLLLLVALAVCYPILFPVGVLLVGCRALVIALRGLRARTPWVRDFLGPTAVLFLAGLAGLAHLELVTADRVASTFSISSPWEIKVKAASSVVALAPLIVGLVLAGLRVLRNHADAAVVLLAAAAACLVAQAVVTVEFRSNEYKFMFPAAMCLTPFAAIAWSRIAQRLGRVALPLFAVLSIALAEPVVELVAFGWPRFGPLAPRVDVSRFEMRLEAGQRHAALADTIRTRAPRNAVLVAGAVGLDLVTLTGRPQYVPYERHPFGLGFASDDLLKRTVGYDAELVDRRLATLREVFQPDGAAAPAAPVNRIRSELGRPLVIVLDRPADSSLASWLATQPDATRLYEDARQAAWLLEPRAQPGSGLP